MSLIVPSTRRGFDETFRTLMLLFPRGHKFTETWYRKLVSTERLDPCVIKCGCLRADDRQFEHFKYWRDRLVILKQVFDESRLSTLSQWWNDRRNGPQWYTFWVAILVLILTIFFEPSLSKLRSWNACSIENFVRNYGLLCGGIVAIDPDTM
jgi:hypothetical protein